MGTIEIQYGDITELEVDAIVNAANNSLLGGGGVDGAIHRAAGKELLDECKLLNGCATGDARITKAYDLPTKHIIHTVGPVWHNGTNNEEELLASCYKKCFELTSKNNINSIAFPNISTGVYGFPKRKAAEIAIYEANKFLSDNNNNLNIIFTIFDEENWTIYNDLIDTIH